MNTPPPPPPPPSVPPPPPPGVPPPPGPMAPGWSSSPPGFGPGFDPGFGPGFGRVPVARPRPRVAVGGWLLVVGGALAFAGSFLPWVMISGESLTGFDDFLTSEGTLLEAPGVAPVVGGLIAVALGIALVAAGRVLAVAIIGIVFSAIGLLVGLGFIVIAADVASWTSGSIGIGSVLQPIGPALALVGSIVATAKRR